MDFILFNTRIVLLVILLFGAGGTAGAGLGLPSLGAPATGAPGATSLPGSRPSSAATRTSGNSPDVLGAGQAGGSRGARPGAALRHLVPGDAIHVSPGGRDDASGSAGSPLRSVGAAVQRASSGQTIVLRGGEYHEGGITIPAGKRLTIQSYPGETVWFDGSVPVAGWRAEGSVWVKDGWTAQFDASQSFSKGSTYAGFVGSANPLAARPDQVFLNGGPLRQVASRAEVGPGTFHVDYGTARLTIGDNPSSGVRASDLEQAFVVSGAGSVLRGLGFRRYANSVPTQGVVYSAANGATYEDLTLEDNATTGLTVIRADNVVRRVTAQRNGLLGLHGYHSDRLQIRDSVVNENNRERFNEAPSAAGMKVTQSRSVLVDNTEFSRNLSAGVWFDETVVGFQVTNSLVKGNSTSGIQAEISQSGIVANNVVLDNRHGIHLIDTGAVRVWNNHVAGSSMMGLKLTQDHRRQSNASTPGHDSRFGVPDPTCPWQVRDIEVVNNVFSTTGLFQVYALDQAQHTAATSMRLTFRGNLFGERIAGRQPTMVALGAGDNSTLLRKQSAADLLAVDGSWANDVAPWGLSVEDMAARGRSAGTAVPLPTDLAAAIGAPAGTRIAGHI